MFYYKNVLFAWNLRVVTSNASFSSIFVWLRQFLYLWNYIFIQLSTLVLFSLGFLSKSHDHSERSRVELMQTSARACHQSASRIQREAGGGTTTQLHPRGFRKKAPKSLKTFDKNGIKFSTKSCKFIFVQQKLLIDYASRIKLVCVYFIIIFIRNPSVLLITTSKNHKS